MSLATQEHAEVSARWVSLEMIDLGLDGEKAGLVRLDRPDQLNAMTWEMHRDLRALLQQLEADLAVRAVLITGSGRAFSAGGDITKYASLQADAIAFTDFVDEFCATLDEIREMTKPVVALVNGICAAGGLELLLACDFAWAATSAQIGDMHLNFAQVGGAGAMARLPRIAGTPKALELVFSATMLSSEEALAWGVVNRVVPDSDLISAGVEFARLIAAKSPRAVATVKRTIYATASTDLPRALRIERDNALAYCLGYPDSMEGIRAFIEKRSPVYKDLS